MDILIGKILAELFIRWVSNLRETLSRLKRVTPIPLHTSTVFGHETNIEEIEETDQRIWRIVTLTGLFKTNYGITIICMYFKKNFGNYFCQFFSPVYMAQTFSWRICLAQTISARQNSFFSSFIWPEKSSDPDKSSGPDGSSGPDELFSVIFLARTTGNWVVWKD